MGNCVNPKASETMIDDEISAENQGNDDDSKERIKHGYG